MSECKASHHLPKFERRAPRGGDAYSRHPRHAPSPHIMASEWMSASESLADALWAGDEDDAVAELPQMPDQQGTSLGSAPRSVASRHLAAAAAEPPPPPLRPTNGPASFVLRSSISSPNCLSALDGDGDDERFGEDFEAIADNLGLSRDEESRMLSTPEGRREWIRKEMLRRERQFTTLTRLRIRTVTWNVNGRSPKVALDEWLLPGGVRPSNGPDVILVALQEVQPLSGMSAVTTDPSRGIEWKDAVEKALDAPNEYVTIAARQMVGIMLVALVKNRHEQHVREVKLADAGTGLMRAGGNKGGVACRFALYDKTISFVSCHFAAHEHNVERRNQDFHDCVRKLVFVHDPNAPDEPSPFSYLEYNSRTTVSGLHHVGDEPRPEKIAVKRDAEAVQPAIDSDAAASANGHANPGPEPKDSSSPARRQTQEAIPSPLNTGDRIRAGSPGSDSSSVPRPVGILEHDACFWAGDLNYRVDLKPKEVMPMVEREEWDGLKKFDQLHNARMNGEVFQGFEEGEIDFAPTYKLERESGQYERKEVEGVLLVKRTPSWTDRILWRDRVRTSSRAGAVDLEDLADGGASSDDNSGEEKDGKPFPGVKRLGRLLSQREGNRGGGVELKRYHRCELLSSDHRPVNADFSLEVRLINIKRRNEVVRRIHHILVRREETLRPLISISSMFVELGQVKYGEVVSNAPVPFSLRNDGCVTAFISIATNEFPAWLTLDPSRPKSCHVLAPGASSEIVFQARVAAHKQISTALNMKMEQLRTIVRLSIQNRIEFLLPIFGTYRPTALGNTLTHLAGCVEPIAKCADASMEKLPGGLELATSLDAEATPMRMMPSACARSSAVQARTILPVPKEIWRLLDFIFGRYEESIEGDDVAAGAHQWESTTFVEEADIASVAQALECVDTGAAFPESLSTCAAAMCLLDILRTLEEPAVPLSCVDVCSRLGEEPVGSVKRKVLLDALASAPPVNGNTIFYLTAFLAELPGPAKARKRCMDLPPNQRDSAIAEMYESVADVDGQPSALALASVFAPVLFRPNVSSVVKDDGFGQDEDERQEELQAKYLCHLMELSRTSGICTVFDI